MNMQTDYMGLELKHPLIASPSPLSETLDGIRKLEDGGAAAVVMFSLFEEQLQHESAAMEHLLSSGAESHPESLSYFPDLGEYQVGPDRYLELLRKATEQTDIPIIASLNGVTRRGWTSIAAAMQEAGASAIELNVYYIPADIEQDGREVEQRYVDIIKAVKDSVSIPVALKMSPFFSAIGNMASRFDQAGADGLVLFNRFYQPDFDLDHLRVVPSLALSTPVEIRLPLLWIALLHGKLGASLAASRGVRSAEEVIKYLLAGADAVMCTSTLLEHGPAHLHSLVEGLEQWMESRGFSTIDEFRGKLSQRHIADPSAYERANYIKILENYRSVFPER